MGWPMWAWLGGPRFWSARAGQVHNGTIRAERLVTRQQGFFSRPVNPNRRPPVPVYRTDLTGNRWKPVEFKYKFK